MNMNMSMSMNTNAPNEKIENFMQTFAEIMDSNSFYEAIKEYIEADDIEESKFLALTKVRKLVTRINND